MPLEMMMHRNRIVRTLSGHTIGFKKGEPISVPDVAVKECLAVGAILANGEELPESVIDSDEPKVVDIPKTPQERRKRIEKLFKEMVADPEPHRTHFTASGRPRSNWVSSTLGFDVPAQEIEEVWMALINPVDDD